MENSNNNVLRLSVLVVDREPDVRRMLCIFLEAEGHSAVAAGNFRNALAEAGKQYFDLALIDLRLETESDRDLIAKLRVTCPWIKLVICTDASIDAVTDAIKPGAFDYLKKPFTHSSVSHVIGKVAEVRLLEQKLSALEQVYNEALPEVMLKSSNTAMQWMLATAGQVADSEVTILIRGERGTGKNVLARAIHCWSGRSKKPFATLSCSDLSAELLESELFGHAKGSFTGALLDYPGQISACHGGTIFLDDIEDMPLSVQAKLLGFIKKQTYERAGDFFSRKADVRIVVATNADLESEIKSGRFREDLFYMLNVVEIIIPPLRERKEDILPIAEHFLAFFARQNHTQAIGFSEKVGDALTSHDWPGNIRELRNTVERAVLLHNGPEIGIQDIFAQQGALVKLPSLGDPVPLEKIEELHIRRVLATATSIEEATRVLKVGPVTLWRKRKKYGI